MEVYVLVSKKKNLLSKIAASLLIAIGVYFVYATLMGVIILFAVAIPFIAIGWWLFKRETEYEYSYFDGEFRFAKIINKSKRKDLRGYEADNVITIAPAGDRSLHQYENNSQVKTRDLSSGVSGARIYCLVAKTESGYEMTKYEPDDKYLDAVCIKYRQKVVR